MKTTQLIETAKRLAVKAHEGQKRNDKTTPYITHPIRVAERLAIQGESEEVIATGYLHDVLEDSDLTIVDMINAGITEPVILAVLKLTKQKPKGSVSNRAYIKTCGKCPIARKVKIADMLDNISDKPSHRQIMRYARALLYLVEIEEKESKKS